MAGSGTSRLLGSQASRTARPRSARYRTRRPLSGADSLGRPRRDDSRRVVPRLGAHPAPGHSFSLPHLCLFYHPSWASAFVMGNPPQLLSRYRRRVPPPPGLFRQNCPGTPGRPVWAGEDRLNRAWMSSPRWNRGQGTGAPSRGRADPAPAAGHLRDHRPDDLRRVQPPRQRERRQQRVAHPAPRAPQPGHEDLPAAARLPDITPVPRPRKPSARHTTGRPGGETPQHGQPPHAHRPQADTAIRWPQATPPRILLAIGATGALLEAGNVQVPGPSARDWGRASAQVNTGRRTIRAPVSADHRYSG